MQSLSKSAHFSLVTVIWAYRNWDLYFFVAQGEKSLQENYILWTAKMGSQNSAN